MQSMKLTLFLDVSVGLKRNHMRHFEGTHLVLMSFIVIPIYGTVGDLTGLDGSWSGRREETYGLHHPSLSQSFLTGWSFSIYCRLIQGHFQVVDWLALGRRPLHLMFQDLMLLWRIARGVGEPRGTGHQPDSRARHHGSYQGWFTFPIDPIWIHVTCWGGWQPPTSHPFRAMSSSTQHKGQDIIRLDQRTSKANSFPYTCDDLSNVNTILVKLPLDRALGNCFVWICLVHLARSLCWRTMRWRDGTWGLGRGKSRGPFCFSRDLSWENPEPCKFDYTVPTFSRSKKL